MRFASTDSTTPSRLATTVTPESRATMPSMPVPTSGDVGAEERHRLALHVRAHERAVRVVVLEERDQRRGHRHQLVRRHVHQVDVLGLGHDELAAVAATTPARRRTCPSCRSSAFAWAMMCFSSCERRVELDLVGDLAVLDLAVRRLDEAVLVDAGVGRQRRDEADVRTFRRLDRADAAVVRRVHVAHFEAGALAGQTARPEGREAALVRDFGERVRLVHELRQLRASRRTPSPPPRPAWR